MPTGLYVRMSEKRNFAPNVPVQYLKMFRWMDAEAYYRGISRHHELNKGGEKRIGPYLVDGYTDDNNLIFQFSGCYFHQHKFSGECKMHLYEEPIEWTKELINQRCTVGIANN